MQTQHCVVIVRCDNQVDNNLTKIESFATEGILRRH